MSKAILLLGFVTLVLAAVPSGDAGSAGALPINAQFDQTWTFASCPAGTRSTTSCYAFETAPVVPGLGQVSVTYFILVDRPSGCTSWSMHGSVSTIAKGTLDLSAVSTGCQGFSTATLTLTLRGTSGLLAQATGTGTFRFGAPTESGNGGTSIGYVEATLDASGVEFDTDPPTLAGVHNRVVRAASRPGARVTFAVTADDAVDGSVPAVCKPASGPRFRVGHTSVHCSATDTSGNTALAHFTVTTVRRR